MDKFIPETRYVEVEFDPFAGPVIERTAPTTEGQREVWVASKMSREASCAYIESVTLCLEGALETAHIRSAITYLGQRHEALRSTISGNGLRVIVMEQMEIPHAYTDLSSFTPQERQARLASIGEQDMEQPFDLLKGPLFRTHLIRISEREHQLRLTGHHVILDGWSMGIVMGDISSAYTAYAEGRQPQLPPAHHFSDFALAQIDFTTSKDFGAVERYWLDLFKESVPRLDLPTDRPRPLQKTFVSHRLDMGLDPALTQRLRELSTRTGSSLVTTLLTCFELLIHKLTGDRDLCIGLPAAGQNDLGMTELVGQCVNLLALRSTIDGDQRFIDHLQERRSAMLDASDNQKYTFGTLVRRLNVPREPGRIPLCPVVFNIDMDMDSAVSFQGLERRVISNPRKFENFELFLNVTGKESSLVLEWSYNTDLFNEETIRSWMGQLVALIERISTTPQAPIRELTGVAASAEPAMLPPAEWLGTFNDYPKVDIPTLFAQAADQYPDNIAVEREDEKITYRELLKRSTTLAHALVGMGVRPGDPIGVCTDRVATMVIGKLAILQAGGCYVPFDPTYPADRLAFMFKDSAVKILLTQRHLLPQLPPHDARTLFPEEIKEAKPCVLPELSADAAAYIMYTSGSTGTPKGVVVPHRGIVRLVRDQFYVPFGPDLTWLQISNVSFDLCTLEIWGALLNGGRCVLQPQMRPSLSEVSDTINRHKVTSVWFTTGLFNLMVDEKLDQLHGLRHIIAGGDVLSVAHVSKALAALGPNVLINGYGPTENTTFTTCHPINTAADIGKSIPIGKPVSNTTVHILDEDLKPVPIGQQGLLWTGGDGVALGYWNRPELTAERFINDPFSNRPNALLYNTGDLARWLPDGTIEFLGRADGQVKVRGFRVELGEVEKAVNEIPEVKDKVVVVSESGGSKMLICYFVPKAEDVIGDAAREGELIKTVRETLGKRLPEYMLPTIFMPIPVIPLTGNGKVDRRSLPEPAAHNSAMKAEHSAPTTSGEKALAEIWERLLGVSSVGLNDNFFDLGGHSLLGIQMLSAVRSVFNVELSLLLVFEAPTLSALAQVISGASRPARTPIVPVVRNGDPEASFGQQRMWTSAQLGRDAYDISQAIQISGTLDVIVLARALDAVVARHEPLRTTFETTAAGHLVQRIHPPADRDLPVENVASLKDAIALCQQKSQQPYDLVVGPLFEPRLYRISDHDHLLFLRMHHIVADEWSIDVLLRDLGSLYQGRALAPLQFSYTDFAAWQRTHFTDEVVAVELDYWRNQLAGAPALLELPTDRPRPPVFSNNGALCERRLPTELWQRIEKLGHLHQATPFMTLLAAFQVLLHRYAGATDISVGTPITNRDQPGSEDLVGFFINTVVLRTDLSGTPSFIDLLNRVRGVTLSAFSHQDIPFERVVEALAPKRTPAHTPLFQVSVVHNSKQVSPEAPGLAFDQVDITSTTSKFDLTLFTVPKPDGLACTLEYNTDLFDAATIDRMLEHFHILLEAIVTDPTQAIDTPSLMSAGERQLLAQWSGGAVPYPRESSIGQLFRSVVDTHSERIAVEMNDVQISYGALNQRMLLIAGVLERAGVGPGDPVGLCSDRCPDMVAAMLAILWRGAAYVPFDPTYPKERLDHMFTDAGVKVLLAQEHLLDTLPTNPAKTILLDDIGDEVPTVEGPQGTGLSPAYIMYTSGSTGKPKGVVVPHRGIVRLVRNQFYVPFGPELTWLQISNVSFDLCTLEVWAPLLNGGRCVLQPQMRPSLSDIADTINRHKVTSVWFTTGLFNLMVDEQLDRLHGLKHIIAGGDVLSVAHVKKALAALGPNVLINGYGPTENTTFTTCYPINDEHAIQARVPIGKPVNNTTVHILNAAMCPVAIREQGEIYTGGDGVALGYWHRPELTAAQFVDDPFSDTPGAKLYRTGDRATWLPDGTIDFLGRADGQVKVRGFRIELGEIEKALNEIPEVKDKVVVVSESGGSKMLTCYFVPQAGDVIGDQEQEGGAIKTVREALGKRLPAYMMPTIFMPIAAIPLTGNGKVDRRALPEPVAHSSALKAEHKAPTTTDEKALAEIWERLLGVSGISLNDNFFDLGGQSLLGIQMISAVRSAFHVEVSLLSVFEAPTLSDFADVVSRASRSARAPIAPVARDGELEASFGQQRMWLSAQFGRDAYDMGQAIRITGTLDVIALARALNAVVARHEPLRTTFEATAAGRLVQLIHPATDRDLPVENVASLKDAIARCQHVSQQPYDLAAGPLFEPRLYRINDSDHVLFLRMHHIVGDEWSIDVLLRDLGSLYQGRTLAPLQFTYADFAAWQRAHFTDEVFARELDHWRGQLSGAPALLELPTDRPRPPVFSNNGALRERRLPTELWQRIEKLGHLHQATPFMTLLAAFQVLLHRYAGATDISVGTPITNRDQPGSEDLVGFFINTVVLRTDLSGTPSFIDLLNRVRGVALSAFSHQDIPFERVVEALALERNSAYAPLFQVSFAHQSTQASPVAPGLAFEHVDIASTTSKFDLTLFTVPRPDGLACTLEYNTDLFDASTIDRMLEHFHILLDAIVTDPTRSIDVLPLLSVNELPTNGEETVSSLPMNEQRATTMATKHVAPRNPTEISLAKLWGELLNTPAPGVHDNFFDLGGQSMIGLRLLARVEDTFGTRLPLNAIFQAPTIARFAELLQGVPLEELDLQNLTVMQPLGDRPPYFCVHGDEANHHLPKYLSNDQPFYAYFHQGEDGSPIQYSTVESIASHFIREMKMVRPKGPYILGGYSFGGIVAYEMAQQLTAAGDDVPLLTMFDTYAPKRYKDLTRDEHRLHEPLKRAIMRWLVKREQARGLISSPRLRHFHIIDTYDKAIRNYQIKRYDGPLTMYKAEKSHGSEDMGWSGLASQLSIRMVPGNHYSLIREPDVEMLAQRLANDINLTMRNSAMKAV